MALSPTLWPLAQSTRKIIQPFIPSVLARIIHWQSQVSIRATDFDNMFFLKQIFTSFADCGDVFAFGEGRYGQLGQGSGLKSEFPRRVPLPLNVNVDTVAAGSTFSIAASCKECSPTPRNCLCFTLCPSTSAGHEQSVFNLLRSRLKRYLEVSVSNLRKLIRVEKMFPENFLIRVLCRDLELNILKAGRNLQVLEYLRLAGRECKST